MSPDKSALPCKRLDSAGRETRRTLAAAVTDRPSGSMISVRMNSPGCGGLNIGIASLSLVLVIIFKIHVTDPAIGIVDPESHPPVPRNMETPGPFPAAGQEVRPPNWYIAKFIR